MGFPRLYPGDFIGWVPTSLAFAKTLALVCEAVVERLPIAENCPQKRFLAARVLPSMSWAVEIFIAPASHWHQSGYL